MWFVAINLVNIAIAIALMQSGIAYPTASALLCVVFLLSGGFFAYLVAGRSRPVSFVLFVFFCYGLAMPGLYQVRTGAFYWASTALTEDLAVKAAWMLLLSLIAFILGYALSPMRGAASATLPEPFVASKRTSIATLLIVLVSIAFSAALYMRFGPVFFFSTRSEVSQALEAAGINSTTRGLTRSLCQAFGIAAMTVSGYMYFYTANPRRMIAVAAWLGLLANLLANFPTSVPRYWLVATLLILLLTWFKGLWTRFRRPIMVAVPCLLYLIFPTLGNFNRRGSELDLTFLIKSPTELMSHGDLDGFQSLMNVVHMVEVQGLSFGKHLLTVLLFFVPRSIWAGKTETVGAEAAAAAGYTFTRISMPFPGEMYVNFGLIGAVIAMILLGSILSRMDRTLLALNGSATFACGSLLLAAFMPILFRGTLLANFSSFAAAMFLVVLWRLLWSVRFRSRPHHHPKAWP